MFDSAGNEVKLNEAIDEVYIVCLTADDYPALVHQIETYLKKQAEHPHPVGMSLFDLEIVAFYLTDRFDFAYYLRQRSALSGYYKASSEITFLGFHLRHKLFRNRDADFISLDNQFAQLIDANFPALRGQNPHSNVDEKLRPKWKNTKFERLVQEVKETNQPQLTDAVFFLLDVSGDSADWLIRRIELAQASSRGDGMNHDFSMSFENAKSGISFIGAGRRDTLGPSLMSLAMARKYKTRADTWLALGSVVGSGRMIDAIAFNKEPWVFDPQMEEHCKVALKPGRAIGPTGQKIGRNDLVLVGAERSGRSAAVDRELPSVHLLPAVETRGDLISRDRT